MYIPSPAGLRQHQRADHIALDCLDLMVFAPVNIRSTSLPGTIDYMSRLHFVKDFRHSSLVLHADTGPVYIFLLSLEKVMEVACDPALLAPYQVLCLHDGMADQWNEEYNLAQRIYNTTDVL